jgi:GH24 family phage-related lysozyme (muramidase)
MKRFLFVLVPVVAVAIGVALYLAWFRVDSADSDGTSNITFSVDRDKFQADTRTAVANVQDVERKIKDKFTGPTEKSMDGTVVSLGADKLTMANKEGKEHRHTLTANVNVSCDGKTCAVTDLKPGMRIRVTTDAADRHAAARIEALDKDNAFVKSSHDGKAVSIMGNKLVMTNAEGVEDHAYTLAADIIVTCDGKAITAADLKPGMRVRVTTETAETYTATRIEALQNNRDFEKGV